VNLLQQWADLFPALWPGLLVTVRLTLAAAVVGVPLGVAFAVAQSARSRAVRWGAVAVVEVGRGAPALIVLYLAYYGLPQVGLALPSFTAASLALAVTTGAYTSEVFRAGLAAVPAGQREASAALGLSRGKEFRLVVLPQAVRTVVPPLVGWLVLLYQGTSLAFAVSTPELLSRAYNAASISYQFTAALTLAGLMYATLSLVALGLVRLPGRAPRASRRTSAATSAGPAA
jgi:polar amino acid transport system permease protein